MECVVISLPWWWRQSVSETSDCIDLLKRLTAREKLHWIHNNRPC
jgi:hypothetical protein